MKQSCLLVDVEVDEQVNDGPASVLGGVVGLELVVAGGVEVLLIAGS